MKRFFETSMEVVAWLRNKGFDVAQQNRDGDKAAHNLMAAYTMVYNCSSDAAAHMVLVERANEYMQAHPAEETT